MERPSARIARMALRFDSWGGQSVWHIKNIINILDNNRPLRFCNFRNFFENFKIFESWYNLGIYFIFITSQIEMNVSRWVMKILLSWNKVSKGESNFRIQYLTFCKIGDIKFIILICLWLGENEGIWNVHSFKLSKLFLSADRYKNQLKNAHVGSPKLRFFHTVF